ncbi:MAG: PAS domain-containing protein [Sneathiellales bacterium]|nr:PAS domain-containing protein [Sneathiellales bacterium]
MKPSIPPTGHERVLGEKEIIVSKTDLSGKIIYANRKFLEISDFKEEEVLGIQHNLIRHPDMPRSIFQFLWQQLKAGEEVFAYVKNLCKNGDHYWVLAHVTPSISTDGECRSYHSNRRCVDPAIVSGTIAPLYQKLVEVENESNSPKQGLQTSLRLLNDHIQNAGGNYHRWLFSLH